MYAMLFLPLTFLTDRLNGRHDYQRYSIYNLLVIFMKNSLR